MTTSIRVTMVVFCTGLLRKLLHLRKVIVQAKGLRICAFEPCLLLYAWERGYYSILRMLFWHCHGKKNYLFRFSSAAAANTQLIFSGLKGRLYYRTLWEKKLSSEVCGMYQRIHPCRAVMPRYGFIKWACVEGNAPNVFVFIMDCMDACIRIVQVSYVKMYWTNLRLNITVECLDRRLSRVDVWAHNLQAAS